MCFYKICEGYYLPHLKVYNSVSNDSGHKEMKKNEKTPIKCKEKTGKEKCLPVSDGQR